jgi:hypothetical protein
MPTSIVDTEYSHLARFTATSVAASLTGNSKSSGWDGQLAGGTLRGVATGRVAGIAAGAA